MRIKGKERRGQRENEGAKEKQTENGQDMRMEKN